MNEKRIQDTLLCALSGPFFSLHVVQSVPISVYFYYVAHTTLKLCDFVSFPFHLFFSSEKLFFRFFIFTVVWYHERESEQREKGSRWKHSNFFFLLLPYWKTTRLDEHSKIQTRAAIFTLISKFLLVLQHSLSNSKLVRSKKRRSRAK